MISASRCLLKEMNGHRRLELAGDIHDWQIELGLEIITFEYIIDGHRGIETHQVSIDVASFLRLDHTCHIGSNPVKLNVIFERDVLNVIILSVRE